MSKIYCTVRKEDNTYLIVYKQDGQLICYSPVDGHSVCQEQYVRQLQKMCDSSAKAILYGYNTYSKGQDKRNEYVLDHKLAFN